jgi:lipopolysaccharide export system protein LptA
MAFTGLTFSVGEVLTASKMNTLDANIDLVRADHIGTSAPAELTAGVTWLDNTSTPWVLKQYDGADWITIYNINATTNKVSFPSIASPLVVGTMTIASGSITDSSGAISFSNENLTTTGTLSSSTLTVSGTVPIITLTDTDTGVDHQINCSSGVGNFIIDVDMNSDAASSFQVKTHGTAALTINASQNAAFGGNIAAATATLSGSLAFNQANPTILGGAAMVASYLTIASGASTSAGANILMYGASHASVANDILFRSGTTQTLRYDDSASTWNFVDNAILTTGTLTCGALTSRGIDDNATGERLQLADTNITLGASGGNFGIVNATNDQDLVLSGGTAEATGANITLYGGAHGTASLVDNIIFRASGTQQLRYSDSGSSWDFQANAITTTGTLAAGVTTLTGGLTVSGSAEAGSIYLEDASTSATSPAFKAIGQRSDSNSSQSFSGKLALARNTTSAALVDNTIMGTIYFGGNHTDGSIANVLYSSSISAEAEGTFSNSTTMPSGLVFFTGSTGRAISTSNVTAGTERMRISNTGDVSILTGDLTVSAGDFTVNAGSATITNTSSGALTAGMLLTNATATSANTAIALYLAPNAAGTTRSASIVSEQTTSGNFADLTFNVAAGSTPFEGMSIATTGNVTIPAGDLTVSSGTVTDEDGTLHPSIVGTNQATTSGTSKIFSGISSYVTQISFSLNAVSGSTSANYLFRLGDAGGIETSGYLGGSGEYLDIDNVETRPNTTHFGFSGSTFGSGSLIHGIITLILIDASNFTWAYTFTGYDYVSGEILNGSGTKSLSAVLTQVEISISAGAFDAGAVNIRTS